MALEDDILAAVDEKLRDFTSFTGFVGTVQSDTPLMVVERGANNAVPALKFVTDTLTQGQRVAVIRLGAQYVVLGALS
jgi:hypothetical protein